MGSFVFAVPSSFFHDNLGAPGLLGWLATGTRDLSEYRRAIDRRLAHLRYLSVEEWRTMLGNAGLELVQASLFMSRAETRRWAVLSNATAGVLVRLSGGKASPIELQRRLGLRQRRPDLRLCVVDRVRHLHRCQPPVHGHADGVHEAAPERELEELEPVLVDEGHVLLRCHP